MLAAAFSTPSRPSAASRTAIRLDEWATPLPNAPLLLLYAPSLQSADGTTVQLRRLLDDFPVPVWHIHGASPPAFAHLPANCVSLPVPLEPRYPFRRGAGFLRRSWRRWWIPRFVRSRLNQAMRERHSPAPRVAYVVVYDELNACFARAALRAAGIDRYVLHLMDLFHPRFDAHTQPNLAALIAEASCVFAVSPRLAAEIAAAARQPVEILPLATGFVRPVIAPTPPAPYLMMSGALYAGDAQKLEFLSQVVLPAWLGLRREIPGTQWHYSGADADSFTPELRAVIRNCGLLEQKEWCATLAGARCALLPVIHRGNEHYRYSVPSRLVDYLVAGIPVVAPSSPDTATGDFLETFANRGVLLANTPAEVHAQLKRLFLDDSFHRTQAAAALATAPGFAAAEIRQRLYATFQQLAA